MERILYLNGIPNVQRLNKINIGETVVEQFRSDLALEYEAVDRLEAGIKVCGEEGDHGSRGLLEKVLHSEEEHIDWLEAQVELVKQVGEQNYLAQQIHKQDAS
jgi:bacterioferritin